MSVTEMKQIFTDGVSLDKPLPMMLNSTEARILGCITGVGDIYTHRHFFPLVCLCVFVSLLLSTRVCTCTRRTKDNLWDLILFFHHVGTGDRTQGGSLAASSLYLLSHVNSPCNRVSSNYGHLISFQFQMHKMNVY